MAACEVTIEPCSSLEELGEVRGALRKLRDERTFDRDFLAKVFDKRDKQLFPRDLLAAFVPTRRSARNNAAKKAGSDRRAVGILRRTLKVDNKRCSSTIYIDLVYVSKEARGLRIGRSLLNAGLRIGKRKDVRLLVAGSDENLAAVKLYESVGFRWTSELRTEMLLEKSELPPDASEMEQATVAKGSVQAPSSGAAPAHAEAAVDAAPGGNPAAAAVSRADAAAAVSDASVVAAQPAQAAVRKAALCVDVGDEGCAFSEHGRATILTPSCDAASPLAGPSPSGVTPHLSHLRISPRLRARRGASGGAGQSPLAGEPRGPPLSPPEMQLPPPCAPSESATSRAGGKRHAHLAEDADAASCATIEPVDGSPRLKSIKATQHASPRSPATRHSTRAEPAASLGPLR
jgi:ribosomal protein S18 acetylase RimI-like enzyme